MKTASEIPGTYTWDQACRMWLRWDEAQGWLHVDQQTVPLGYLNASPKPSEMLTVPAPCPAAQARCPHCGEEIR